MKRFFTLLAILLCMAASAQTNFTPGNVVLLRVGDGASALSSAATATFLEERTPDGTLVQTIAMPTSVNGGNYRIALAGSATSEGQLTVSADGRYICFAGYDASPGTAGVAASNAARIAARVDMAGNINTSTAITDGFLANSIRGVVSNDGTGFWFSGNGSSGNGGIRYSTLGSSSSTQVIAAPNNGRCVNIFNGQLYGSASSSPYFNVFSVGTGIPTTSGQTATVLPGLPNTSGQSTYGFAINPTGDMLYVADDRTTSDGGVYKYVLLGGSWTFIYKFVTGSNNGCRGLAVDWGSSNPIIYATTNATTSTIVKIVDDGSPVTATATTISTAASKTAYRGVVVVPSFSATWNGGTNNNWNTASNWTPAAVPSSYSLVTIPSGTPNSPSNGSSVTVTSINVASGVILTNTTLNVLENLTNNGTITGTVNLNGSASQSIIGTGTVTNLTINNAFGATINSGGSNKVNLKGVLTLSNGTLTTGSNLVLKSSSLGTGSIATITGGSISGTVTQERFVLGKTNRTWSLLASPFAQTIANGWQQQVHITGAGTGGAACPTVSQHTNGFDATLTNAASMFIYDGTKAVGSRWASVTSTNAVALTPGTGYRMNIRGPRSLGCSLLDGTVNSTDDVVLSSTGTMSAALKNMGSFTTTVANNGVTDGINDNYLLVGNPYPSPISFSALQAANNTATGISNKYVVYAPGNTVGNYAFWNGSTFTGGINGVNNTNGNIIANGQAFFVQAQTAGGNITLNWNENMKTSSTFDGYFRQLNPNRIRIGYELANGNKADEIMVLFAADGTTAQLNKEDMLSMNSGSQHLKSIKDGKGLAFNNRNSHFVKDTVQLLVASSTNGNFKLSFYDFDGLVQDNQTKIYLLDRYLGTTQLLNDNPAYAFTINTAQPATQGMERFAVVFSKPAPITLTPTVNIKAYPNPFTNQLVVSLPQANGQYTIKLVDVQGRILVQQQAKGNCNISTGKLTAGTYIVEVTILNGDKQVQKVVKQ